MPDINSPLGRRAFAMDSKRVLTVPNVEDAQENYQSSQEVVPEKGLEAIQAIRKNKLTTSKRINPVAKERIAILANLGRCFEEVEFENVTFSIQSLKNGEMRDVVRLSNTALDAADAFFEGRTQVLARSIYEIDGQPISLVLGASSLEEVVAWVEDLDEALVDFIHNKYVAMVKKNKSLFVIKDQKDAEEVSEEIKK